MAARCWLHSQGGEHDVVVLVGVRSEDAGVVPADLDCAKSRGLEDWIEDPELIDVAQ